MPVDIQLIRKGKVRDIYSFDDDHLLFVTSNRISAFDVVLPNQIPGKGKILNDLSVFWKRRFESLVPNDLTEQEFELEFTDGDSQIVKKLEPLKVEAIVRGYIIGSGWKDYQQTGAICGINLPAGLQLAEQLPKAIYTPSSKADVGDHDENISFDDTVEILGFQLAGLIGRLAVDMYTQAAEYALSKGIIIADTKFEFGLDEGRILHLMDEVLTPDSSRFWPADEYQVGVNPSSYDKQIVRDYLETLAWDKKEPGPVLPDEIIERTARRYQEVADLLMG